VKCREFVAVQGALVVPDQQGNLRITVKKTKPILGIAIEGGANTKHPLPRIINIHVSGAIELFAYYVLMRYYLEASFASYEVL
jgi:hypothetical protein